MRRGGSKNYQSKFGRRLRKSPLGERVNEFVAVLNKAYAANDLLRSIDLELGVIE